MPRWKQTTKKTGTSQSFVNIVTINNKPVVMQQKGQSTYCGLPE